MKVSTVPPQQTRTNREKTRKWVKAGGVYILTRKQGGVWFFYKTTDNKVVADKWVTK